jgi:uncharacterized protein with GYD domain
MTYVLLGTLNMTWDETYPKRLERIRACERELNIKPLSVLYTQGYYDLVLVVDAPDPDAVLHYSVWYSKQGYGRLTTMPAFEERQMIAAAVGPDAVRAQS